MSPMELTYRRMAAGTSGLGSLIALYDTLAGDLRRAAEAERGNKIEKRCREMNHALLVIAFLENRLAQGSGGALADQLSAFYSSLRRKLIVAQAKRSAELIEQQMALVLKFREQWQGLEFRPGPAGPGGPEVLAPVQRTAYAGALPAQRERQLSWSA
jgi:flagellar secretion chaperone FliS